MNIIEYNYIWSFANGICNEYWGIISRQIINIHTNLPNQTEKMNKKDLTFNRPSQPFR